MLHKRFNQLCPNSNISFTNNHYRFLKSNGQRGRHLPKHKGQYFHLISELFELQKKINERH